MPRGFSGVLPSSGAATAEASKEVRVTPGPAEVLELAGLLRPVPPPYFKMLSVSLVGTVDSITLRIYAERDLDGRERAYRCPLAGVAGIFVVG